MSSENKRVSWQKMAVKNTSVTGKLKPNKQRQGLMDDESDREGMMIMMSFFVCSSFAILVIVSAVRHGMAYYSPFLNFIGAVVCLIVEVVLAVIGAIVWLITKQVFIFDFVESQFPVGHQGLYRTVLATVPLAIALWVGFAWVGIEWCRTKGSAIVFIVMAIIIVVVMVMLIRYVALSPSSLVSQ